MSALCTAVRATTVVAPLVVVASAPPNGAAVRELAVPVVLRSSGPRAVNVRLIGTPLGASTSTTAFGPSRFTLLGVSAAPFARTLVVRASKPSGSVSVMVVGTTEPAGEPLTAVAVTEAVHVPGD